jgi:hypothetical protein
MKLRVLAISCLLLFSSAAFGRATISETKTVAERADAQAAKISDAEAYMEEIDANVRMARAGDYGRLHKAQLARIETARRRVGKLFEGHESAMELPLEERIELYNEIQAIQHALKADDKDRIICKRGPRTGSRLAVTECNTVAQLQQRAKFAKEMSNDLQRMVCVPEGEGSRCK